MRGVASSEMFFGKEIGEEGPSRNCLQKDPT